MVFVELGRGLNRAVDPLPGVVVHVHVIETESQKGPDETSQLLQDPNSVTTVAAQAVVDPNAAVAAGRTEKDDLKTAKAVPGNTQKKAGKPKPEAQDSNARLLMMVLSALTL